MSSSAVPAIATLEYREFPPVREPSIPISLLTPAPVAQTVPPAPPGYSEAELQARLHEARTQVAAETEGRLRAEWTAREAELQSALGTAMRSFEEQRTTYFRGVEAEVVHLALAVSRKILERETVLDPTLLSALVRIALDRMGASPAVRLRVAPDRLAWWKAHGNFDRHGATPYALEVIADEALAGDDCVVETHLGAANFGFDSQLKEIERGFLDLLACRPGDLARAGR